MPLPGILEGRLSIPVVQAPMFLVSNPIMVTEACKNGVVGSFPALNQRSSEGFEDWLKEISGQLQAYNTANPDRPAAPFGVNLIVHASNPRMEADLKLCIKYKEEERKAWRDIFSAGQGVGSIKDTPTTAALCTRLREEYGAVIKRVGDDAWL